MTVPPPATIAAAIDAGSNSIRLLVAAVDGRGRLIETVAAKRRTTRLGTGLDRHGRLDRSAIERSLLVFREYVRTCLSLGAAWVTAAGTAALRDATDGSDFVDRVRGETGVAVTVVSQADEAALSLRGAARVIGKSRPAALADIGGRSTEVIIREGASVLAYGLPLGVVRLSEAFPLSDPPRREELAALTAVVERAVGETGLPETLKDGTLLAGTGGTFAQLAALDLRLDRYDPDLIDGHRLGRKTVDDIQERLAGATLAERIALPGMEADRADVIIHGVTVAHALMRRFGRDEMTVCDADILAGMLPAAVDGFGGLAMTPAADLRDARGTASPTAPGA